MPQLGEECYAWLRLWDRQETLQRRLPQTVVWPNGFYVNLFARSLYLREEGSDLPKVSGTRHHSQC